jgi:hypothetical protein
MYYKLIYTLLLRVLMVHEYGINDTILKGL